MAYSSDKISIETPEQITLEFPLAGIGSRFLAIALDTVIQTILYTLIVLGVIYLLTLGPLSHLEPSTPTQENWLFAIVLLLIFCVYWGYFALFEIFWNGQTPGKRVVGIRVIKDTGRPVTAIESVGRNLMRAIDSLPTLYGVGLVTMIISKQNRRLGDYVAGTLVVHDSKATEIKPDWSTADAAQLIDLAGQLNQLGDDDLVIIETYLQRRRDLEPMVRINMAVNIGERIRRKANLDREPGQSDDDFLESVARLMRDHARLRASSLT